MNTRDKILNDDIGKLLLRFGLPSLLATVINALYNVVDRIFVGQVVGEIGLAAITVCSPIMMILMAFGMLFAIGGSSLISLYMGKDDKGNAEKVLGNGFAIIIIIMTLFSVGSLIFLDPLLKFFGADATTLAPAKTYLSIILLVAIPHEIGFGVNGYIRSEGSIKYSVITTIVGSISNIIFNAFFIFVIPLGVKGVAIGTALAYIVRMSFVLYFYASKMGILRFSFKNLKLDSHIIKRILFIGAAPSLTMLLGSLSVGFLNNQFVAFGGSIAIAAYGIQNSVFNILTLPIMGLTSGAQPIIGYNYGAKLYKRVTKTLKYMLVFTVVFSVFTLIILLIIPKMFIGMFVSSSSPIMSENMVRLIVTSLIMLPLTNFNRVCTSYFQSVGKAKQAIVLSISRMGVFLPITLFLMTRYILPSLTGVWLTLPISDVLAFVIASTAIIYEWRTNLSKNISSATKAV